uniref:Uncharacterized protein n=1 Tax=Salvator merianae TaxID=96440 RepID=A0A8D0C2E0_SALMN
MAGHTVPIKLRQTKTFKNGDVLGYYPGQLARLHFAYPPEGLFTELRPIPVEHEIVPYHDYDYIILNQYIYYQRTRKKLLDWYILTTYREAFTLPIYKLGG